MVGVVENKAAVGVFAIAGLVGRQRSANRVKLRENSNSPSTTRSKSVIMRAESTGSEESVKGKRRSFAVMHNSMEVKH